jgi:hypothetical protein
MYAVGSTTTGRAEGERLLVSRARNWYPESYLSQKTSISCDVESWLETRT